MLIAGTAWGQNNRNKIQGLHRIEGNTLNSISNKNNGNKQSNNPFANTSKPVNEADSLEGQPKGVIYHEDIPDSILLSSVFTFKRQPLDVKIMEIFHPLLDPTGAQYYDQLEGLNGNYYLSTGELGHPHYGLFRDWITPFGLSYKPNVFEGIYLTASNINFYQTQRPYSSLSYHSTTQKDFIVHATHTQNITPRWNIAFDYDLINPKGIYANSAARDHRLYTTTNYYSSDARYQMSSGIIWQSFSYGENGGLSNDDIFIHKQIRNFAGIPVVNSQGGTTQKDVSLFTHHSFNTVRQFDRHIPRTTQIIDTIAIDTSWAISETFDSIPQIQYRTRLRDSLIRIDTFFVHTPRVLNTGVFALNAQYDQHKYRYADSNRYRFLQTELFWTNDAYMDHRWHNPFKMTIGISAQKEQYFDYVGTISRQLMYPFAKTQIMLGRWAEFTVHAKSTPSLDQYQATAHLSFPFVDTLGQSHQTLALGLDITRQDPQLIYALRSSRPLSQQLTQRATFKYTHKEWLDFYFAANQIKGNTWFDSSFVTSQSNDEALLLQARLTLKLQAFHWLHLDMQQLLQHSNNQELVRVPLWATKNSLYADVHLFHNALRAQIGFDLRYHTAFYADAYNPQAGLFYRQDEILVGDYYYADFFITLQIKRASIYVKAGHLNSLIEPEQHYFYIPHYPGRNFGIFYGLTWKFFD